MLLAAVGCDVRLRVLCLSALCALCVCFECFVCFVCFVCALCVRCVCARAFVFVCTGAVRVVVVVVDT